MTRFTCFGIVLIVLVVLVDCRGGRGGGGSRGSSGSSGRSSGYSSGSGRSSGSTGSHSSSYSSSYNSRLSPQASPSHSFDHNSWKKSLPNLGTISKPSQFKLVVSTQEKGIGSSIIPVSTGARNRNSNTERPRMNEGLYTQSRTTSTVARPSGSTNSTTSTSGHANTRTYGRTVYNSTGQYKQTPSLFNSASTRPLSSTNNTRHTSSLNTTALHAASAPPLESFSSGKKTGFQTPSAPPMDQFPSVSNTNKLGSNADPYKASAPPLDNPGFITNPRQQGQPLGFANTGGNSGTNQPIGWNFDSQKQFGQSSNQGFGISNSGVNPGTQNYQGASPGFHATQGAHLAGYNSASNNYGMNYNSQTSATNYRGLNFPSATNYQGVNSHTPTNYQGVNNNYPTNQGFNSHRTNYQGLNTNYQGVNNNYPTNQGFNTHGSNYQGLKTNYQGVNFHNSANQGLQQGSPNYYPNHNQGYYQQNMYQPGMSGYHNMPSHNYYQPTNLPPPPPGYSPVMSPTYQKSSSGYGTKIVLGLAVWQLMKGNQHHHYYQNSYQPGYQTGFPNSYTSSSDTMDFRPKYTTYYTSSNSNSKESSNVIETTHYITPDLIGNSTVLKGNMTCTTRYNMDAMGEWSNFTLNDFKKQYPNSTFPLFASPNSTDKFDIIQGPIIHNETVSITCCGTQTGPIDIQLLSSGKNKNVNCVHFVKKISFRKLIFYKENPNETWVPIQIANDTHFGTPLAPFPNITTHFGTPLAPMPTLGTTGNGTQFGNATIDGTVDLEQTYDSLGANSTTEVNLNQTFSSLNASDVKNVGNQTFLALGANSTTITSIV